MLDILRNPDHWQATKSREDRYAFYVEAISLDQFEACPKCEAPKEELRPNGHKDRHLIDAPQLSESGKLKRVQIIVSLQRYVCKNCGKSSLQPLEGVTGDERITARLKLYAAEGALLGQYADVARQTQLSRRVVRELCAEYTGFLEANERPGLASVLSIDGVYYHRKERIMVTAPERKLVIEVFPGGDAEAICASFLGRFTASERDMVRVVVIDMSSTLRLVASSSFPNAKVVIDRFHVFKKANEAVDGVREALRKKRSKQRRAGEPTMVRSEVLRKHRKDLNPGQERQFDKWLKELPELDEAYELKELFSTLWFSSSQATAMARYEAWLGELATCSQIVREQFRKHLTRTIADWGRDIFAYFDDRFNSGFTERANREVKDLNSNFRRLSFESMRVKMIYGTLLKLRRADEEQQHTKYRAATMNKPRKGPWTVTQKPPKKAPKRMARPTQLAPIPNLWQNMTVFSQRSAHMRARTCLDAARTAAPGFVSAIYGTRLRRLPIPRVFHSLVGIRPEYEAYFLRNMGRRISSLGKIE